MDWTSLVISLGIAIYGVVECRRRERGHRERVEALRRGVMPVFEPARPQLWQLLTTGGVELLLLGFSGWLWYKGFGAGHYIGAYAQIAGFFTILAVLVLVMFVDLIGRYSRSR